MEPQTVHSAENGGSDIKTDALGSDVPHGTLSSVMPQVVNDMTTLGKEQDSSRAEQETLAVEEEAVPPEAANTTPVAVAKGQILQEPSSLAPQQQHCHNPVQETETKQPQNYPQNAEDDPNSELNVLRREVRRLQSAVRIATLQAAVQQEELMELREEREEVQAREAILLSRLEAERRRVRQTMEAAEVLVQNLRNMELEELNHTGAHTSANSLRRNAFSTPSTGLASDPRLQDFEDEQDYFSSGAVGNDYDFSLPDDITDDFNHSTHRDVSDNASERNFVQSTYLAENRTSGGISRKSNVHRVSPTNVGDTHTLDCQTENDVHEDTWSGSSGWTSALPQVPTIFSVIRNTTRRLSTRSAPARSATRARAPPGLAKQSKTGSTAPSEAEHLPANAVSAEKQQEVVVASPMMVAAFKSSSPDLAQTVIHSPPKNHAIPPPISLATADVSSALSQPRDSNAVPRDPFPSAVTHVVVDAHEGEIFALASSPDGVLVASGGDDKIVRLYDCKLRKTSTLLLQCTRPVTSLAFDPTGDIIAGGLYDGMVRLWRKDSSRKRIRWVPDNVQPYHSAPVRRVIFDSSGTVENPKLLSASVDRSIKLTDISSGKRPFVAYAASAVFDISVPSANGPILSGHKDGSLRMWSPKDGANPVAEGAKAHSRSITSVSCLEDGFGIVTLGRDNNIKLSDMRVSLSETVREMDVGVKTLSDWQRAALFGRHVACGLDSEGAVGVWNVDSGKMVRKLTSQQASSDSSSVFELLQGTSGPARIPVWTNSMFITGSSEKRISYWE